MNHLAHAFLAADTPESIIGNLSGDFVRGLIDNQLNSGIADGIRLHRRVDSFTDSHAIPRRSRKRFTGTQRRVAGIVVDVYYDYFLCQHWEDFSDESLPAFCARIYAILLVHQSLAPVRFRNFIPGFTAQYLLTSCNTLEGVQQVFDRLSMRWNEKPELKYLLLRAGADAQQHYTEMQSDFLKFFPLLVREADAFKHELQLARQN